MTTALPVTYPLTVYHGTTFAKTFRWRPDGTTLQDFTGWSAHMWVRAPGLGPTLALTTASGLTLSSVGEVSILISAVGTKTLRPGAYLYNLDLTEPGGDVIRFLRGEVDVIRDAEPT